MARIYVASSWKNIYYPEVVAALRKAGHQVYDFRNPPHGGNGFHWTDIDEYAPNWTFEEYAEGLNHPLAEKQFHADISALYWADFCVLVLPCGRSAHTEAGYMAGKNKRVIVYFPEMQEPELMYKLFNGVANNLEDLCSQINMLWRKGDELVPVDLGLSVCWANRNYGSITEDDPGEYIGWRNLGRKVKLTNLNGRLLRFDSNWRLPRKEEFLELVNSCSRKVVTVHGHKGEMFTGTSGESIFFPYGGSINPSEDYNLCGLNQYGSYLCRTRTYHHSNLVRIGDEEIVFEPSGVLDLHMSVRLVLADSSKKYGQEE